MPKGRRFVIVFVVDGLRPDAITHELTPTLFRLRSEGVDFTNSHSVFPTVTRVNAAAIGTGMHPGSTGILGNQMYAAVVDSRRALDTGNHRKLLELDQATGGRLVLTETLAEPDHSQHHLGVGSASALEALANDDREIARVLKTLDDRGLMSSTDVLVVSDHGFTTNVSGVDVAGALIEAGLKAAADSSDVVLASSGQAVAVHVEGHDRDRIAAIARLVQSREWGGVVFTRGWADGDTRGAVDGTFSLELIHVANAARGPDLLFTFPWTSRANAFGVPGTDRASISGGAKLYASDHGSMSPWNVRNTFVGWGVDFKKRSTVRTPVGNVDVAPTILALLGITEDGALDGRVLAEALEDGPDAEQIAVDTRVHTVEVGDYRAAIQVSEVDGRRYVDKSWRIR